MKKKPAKKKAKKKAQKKNGPLYGATRGATLKRGSTSARRSNRNDEEKQRRLELVCALVTQTAALELTKSEYIELAPLPGVCGPFKLSGNSLPVFEYRVFDPRKNPFMMEFIKVRVEVSKPDRIHYIAHIDSKGSADPARHGEEVEVLPKYKEPFEKLAQHLRNYFPYWRNPKDERDSMRWDKVRTYDSHPIDVPMDCGIV